ncbi:SpoIIE family protein phosphatase [Kitasatospora paracochleata]|uniref:Serine phosphatase RsbU (Regulator of sigma subunit)/PAS domain-containing protein n=1 Tax=Kitasatospora paracochleata TaxID=58354 RepID=A0ABT1J217_9ACTN|nr:SpoIIE family protein phosphatase [Kitasatospora paracochleata]MCP2311469.1 serine phosphatase RsbU (regulator of sigma subunit)/PAS domain-containing protein [Kitasatospora paracochleata]
MGGVATRPHGRAADAGSDADTVAYLDGPFQECLRQVGATAGAVYLRDADRGMLRLALLAGLPLDVLSPWLSAAISAPLPGADAYREQHFVWVGSQEEMARAYPRVAAALPYPFALAALPITGAHRWGALLLMWPPTHPPVANSRERRHLTAAAHRLARLIDTEARRSLPLPPRTPRVLAPARAPGLDPRQHALAAADVLQRLPSGACGLDLQGRFSYVSPKAADLLGSTEADLLGTLPWHSIPWLDNPVCEDGYRAALVSREPVSFTAVRPPDDGLLFRLYPDSSGITVLVSEPAAGPAEPESAPGRGAAPRSAAHLYQVVHVAAALTEAATVREVAEVVAEQIMPVVDAQAALLYAVTDGRLGVVGHAGYPPGIADLLDGAPLDTAFSAAARAADTGRALFFGSAGEIDRFSPRLSEITGKRAWAILPLATHREPAGCCVFAYDRERTFGANERAVFTSLAGLIAQALDRAQLYDEQSRLAHGLQQALLPRALDHHPRLEAAARYLPATRGMDIGGDFYDLIRIDDATVVAVIGDVEGHNVAAAAMMGQVRTAIRAHTSAGAPPDQVLARTSRLLDDLHTELLASCLYIRLDLARHRALLASAGHLPPMFRPPGGNCAFAGVAPGPLLGILRDPEYPMTELAVPPDSLLGLFTDGLVEAPGVDLDRQLARCAALVDGLGEPGDGRLEALLDTLLQEWSHDLPRSDDIAVLLLHTRP